MTQLGSCAHCKLEWHGQRGEKAILPVRIPTCTDGGILAVCVHCFDKLPEDEIIAIVISTNRGDRSGAFAAQTSLAGLAEKVEDQHVAGYVRHMKAKSASQRELVLC